MSQKEWCNYAFVWDAISKNPGLHNHFETWTKTHLKIDAEMQNSAFNKYSSEEIIDNISRKQH
jgi:hypothetical protein